MILDFFIENYRSIGNSLKIDFRVSDNQKLSGYTEIGGLNVNKIACLVGANASGKSNILCALAHFIRYMCHSYAKPEFRNNIALNHFCRDNKTTEFGIAFLEDGIEYKYFLSLLNNAVQYESLDEKNKRTNRYNSVFVREKNNVKSSDIKINNTDLDRLTEDISLFSLLLYLNYFGKNGFTNIRRNMLSKVKLPYIFNAVNPFAKISNITKKLRSDNALLQDLIDELRRIDTRISKLEFAKGDLSVKDDNSQKGAQNELEALISLHNVDGRQYPLYLLDESSGTVNFIELFAYLYYVLQNGGMFIADELEQSLHPDLTQRIINMFLDKDKNPNNAQLLFTTHNSWFLHNLTKTQIFIVDKNYSEETEITRLDDIKGVRNDENYFLKYISGAYDGKPKIKEI